jgi:hypothetical protein
MQNMGIVVHQLIDWLTHEATVEQVFDLIDAIESRKDATIVYDWIAKKDRSVKNKDFAIGKVIWEYIRDRTNEKRSRQHKLKKTDHDYEFIRHWDGLLSAMLERLKIELDSIEFAALKYSFDDSLAFKNRTVPKPEILQYYQDSTIRKEINRGLINTGKLARRENWTLQNFIRQFIWYDENVVCDEVSTTKV